MHTLSAHPHQPALLRILERRPVTEPRPTSTRGWTTPATDAREGRDLDCTTWRRWSTTPRPRRSPRSAPGTPRKHSARWAIRSRSRRNAEAGHVLADGPAAARRSRPVNGLPAWQSITRPARHQDRRRSHSTRRSAGRTSPRYPATCSSTTSTPPTRSPVAPAATAVARPARRHARARSNRPGRRRGQGEITGRVRPPGAATCIRPRSPTSPTSTPSSATRLRARPRPTPTTALAKWADQALTDDGVLVVLTGQTWLPRGSSHRPREAAGRLPLDVCLR